MPARRSRSRSGGRQQASRRVRAARRSRGAAPSPLPVAPPLTPAQRRRQEDREHFGWRETGTFTPNVPVFDRTTAGITEDFPVVDEEAPEVDYFQAFFSQDLLDHVCTETNRYQVYDSVHNPDTTPGTSKMRGWTPVTVPEMYVFLALTMLTCHVKKHVLKDYWSHDDLIETPLFSKFMPRDRYTAILRYLHFADNDFPSAVDRLWKVRHVLSFLTEKFKMYFVPFQNVVIDESLVLFRGRVVFRQYIPSKRHRYGIKFFVLCDCETGYVQDMIVYTASDVDIPNTDTDPHGFSGAVVKQLMQPYLGKNHILYTDNYYTAPYLTEYLLDQNTGTVGTVRPTRRGWPEFRSVPKGDVATMHSDNILAIRFVDNKPVNVLSTVHPGNIVDTGKVDFRTGERILKPDAVVDYNVNMRLVDKSDMQVASVESLRKCCKWYKKTFLHLMDIVILNSYNLWMTKTGKRTSLRAFSLAVIRQMCEKFGLVQPLVARTPLRHPVPDRLQARDYISRHHLVSLPPTASRARPQRRCYVCRTTQRRPQTRKDVKMWCPECRVALCSTCFVEFHTLRTY